MVEWKDKYLELCEKTLHSPNKTVIKGTLLSHLKLNMSPVMDSSCPNNCRNNDDASKKPTKKKSKSKCSLQRKKCILRTDSRSTESKQNSIKYYEREIIELPVYEELDLLTADGYLIPEELKEKIRKARSESQERVEFEKFLKERGLPKHPTDRDDEVERFEKRESGTYISIAYRNSKKEVKVDSDQVHRYVKIRSQSDDREDIDSPYSIVKRKSIASDCMHGIPIYKCLECDEPIYAVVEHACDSSSDTESMNGRTSSSPNSKQNEFRQDKEETLPVTYLKKTLRLSDSTSTVDSGRLDDLFDTGDEDDEELDPFYYVLDNKTRDSITHLGKEDVNNNCEELML